MVLQLYKHLTAGSFFFFQLHSNVIRDVMFLHESWPWCKGQNALLTVAIDGTAKVFYGINDRQQFYLFGELMGRCQYLSPPQRLPLRESQ